MAYKATCKTLQKVDDDEPIFVLRAQDKLAPATVRQWVVHASFEGVNKEKLKEAMNCAEAMEQWANRKLPD